MFCRQYRVIASAERNFIRIPIKFQYTRRFSSFPLFHLTIFQSFFPLLFSFNIKPIWIIQRRYVYSRRSLFFLYHFLPFPSASPSRPQTSVWEEIRSKVSYFLVTIYSKTFKSRVKVVGKFDLRIASYIWVFCHMTIVFL